MRLIDADKLIYAIKEKLYLGGEKNSIDAINVVLKIIDDEPTAYNVEEVVEELRKEAINVMLPNGFREPCVTLKTAETIVKAGGQYEVN